MTTRRIILPLFLCVLAAHSLLALDIPPKPTAWVTDQANVLSAADEQALNEKLEAFARRSGSQFLIFLFPTLGDEAIEDYTIRVAEQWKTREDRALIIFVFVQERKIRIEVGYGLEGSVPDMIARSVIADYIGPRFRSGDYAGGLNAGVDALIARIEGREAPIPHDVPRQRGAGGSGAPVVNPIFVLFIILIFAFFILPLLRRGGGGCVGCLPIFPFPGGGGGITFGGGGGGFSSGGGGGWSVGGSWGGGGGGSFGGGGATGGW